MWCSHSTIKKYSERQVDNSTQKKKKKKKKKKKNVLLSSSRESAAPETGERRARDGGPGTTASGGVTGWLSEPEEEGRSGLESERFFRRVPRPVDPPVPAWLPPAETTARVLTLDARVCDGSPPPSADEAEKSALPVSTM